MTKQPDIGKRLILASSSPRRQQLLKQIGLSFILKPSTYDEGQPRGPACQFVRRAAIGKAENVANNCRLKNGWIIAADTIVVQRRTIFGKPQNQREAEEMIKSLSGKSHRVLTGVVLFNLTNNRFDIWVEATKVFMRFLTSKEIGQYIASAAWQGKAGAYGIQDKAAAFISRIEGCYFNVMGLPLASLTQALIRRGVL